MSKPEPRVLTSGDLMQVVFDVITSRRHINDWSTGSLAIAVADAIMALTFETRCGFRGVNKAEYEQEELSEGTVDYYAEWRGATRHVLVIGDAPKPYDDAARRKDAEALAEWVVKMTPVPAEVEDGKRIR